MTQIITHNGIAKYAFYDSDQLNITDKHIDTPNFRICDLNSGNSTLYTGVSNLPQDFDGDLYYYNGIEFTAI